MHAYVNVARDLACKHLSYMFLVLQWGCDEMGEMGSSLVRSCGCTSSGLAVRSDALVKKIGTIQSGNWAFQVTPSDRRSTEQGAWSDGT